MNKTEDAQEREARNEFARTQRVLGDSIPTLPSWVEGVKVAGLEGWTSIAVDEIAMKEASYIASLYAGVPHAVGVYREAEYRRLKEQAALLAASGTRRRL
jgi:hypothetical protein